MATIQIRNVPADVHRIYQRRARDAGMSLQQYLLVEIVRGAKTRSPADLIAEVESRMRAEGAGGFMRGSAGASVRR
jgi:antitoxin FitA